MLPSTTSSVTRALTKVSGCGNWTAAACVDWHGGVVDTGKSDTWRALGEGGEGLERMGLGGLDGGVVGVDGVVVLGVEGGESMSMGALGLSPRGMNGSDSGLRLMGQSSLIQRLSDEELIPSLSWGYTAGAGYCKSPSLPPTQ